MYVYPKDIHFLYCIYFLTFFFRAKAEKAAAEKSVAEKKAAGKAAAGKAAAEKAAEEKAATEKAAQEKAAAEKAAVEKTAAKKAAHEQNYKCHVSHIRIMICLANDVEKLMNYKSKRFMGNILHDRSLLIIMSAINNILNCV